MRYSQHCQLVAELLVSGEEEFLESVFRAAAHSAISRHVSVERVVNICRVIVVAGREFNRLSGVSMYLGFPDVEAS